MTVVAARPSTYHGLVQHHIVGVGAGRHVHVPAAGERPTATDSNDAKASSPNTAATVPVAGWVKLTASPLTLGKVVIP